MFTTETLIYPSSTPSRLTALRIECEQSPVLAYLKLRELRKLP
jgi:hypothetical protein